MKKVSKLRNKQKIIKKEHSIIEAKNEHEQTRK